MDQIDLIFKLFLDHLGCINKRLQATLSCFRLVLAHATSQKALKWAISGLIEGQKGGKTKFL